MLLAVKSFEIFPTHKGYFLFQNLLLPLWCRLKQNFVPDLVKLIEYWVSAVNVWFNPCVGACIGRLSPPKINFVATLPSDKEWSVWVSNQIP